MAPGTGHAGRIAEMPGGQQPSAAKSAWPYQAKWS